MLTGYKDVDLLILENLEHKDLLNLCLVNKYANKLCKDENFWRNYFIREHGIDLYKEAMNYKNLNKTWKTFYMQIVYYWNKSPNDSVEKVNNAMNMVAKEGHKDLVYFFVSKGAKYWNWGMYGAALGGNKDLVDFFIEKGANDWDEALYESASGDIKI